MINESALKPTGQAIDSNAELTDYTSPTLRIGFKYPRGWVIDEVDGAIYLAAELEHLPWGMEYYSSPREPYYHLYSISPYGSRLDRILGREQSVEQLAEAIAYTFEVGPIKGELLEPIRSLEINGNQSAQLVIKIPGKSHYILLLALAPNHIIVLSGNGSVNKLDEMRAVVDDIAASLRSTK